MLERTILPPLFTVFSRYKFLFFLGTPGAALRVRSAAVARTLRAQVVHSMDGPPRQPRLGNLTVTKPVPNFLRQFQAPPDSSTCKPNKEKFLQAATHMYLYNFPSRNADTKQRYC